METLLDPLPSDKLVHPPKEQPPLLQQLEFLVGRFQGDGSYSKGSRQFHKDMVGAWEAGGQFLSLRMRVVYPLKDGLLDLHEACVMVGCNATSQQLEARAYTDGGGLLDYELSYDGHSLSFPDRPPGHQSEAKPARRARKILSPHETGFEERLEVDFGTGEFEPYALVLMRRK